MIFERQSEIVYVLRQFGDSVRKPVPCRSLNGTRIVLTSIPTLVVKKISNLIWLFRKTRFSQPINQVLHIFCAFENGYPFLGAANAVSWI
jgi:hypothetical protein